MTGGVHLRPHPPNHAAPSAAPASSMLVCNGRSKPCLRPWRSLRMQTGTSHHPAGPVFRCTADRPCEPSPEEDPRDAHYRKFRDDMDKFAREYGAALRALGAGTSQDAMIIELEATLFRDEEDKLRTYVREIYSDRCILYREGRGLAWMVCFEVGIAIHIAAMVLANAHLRISTSCEMSSHIVEQITRAYVSTFLSIADDTCHRKVDRTSIISFLDALRGLAAISHILFEDALVAVNSTEDGSSNYYNPEYNVEALKHELEFNMEELVTEFTKASEKEAYELLCRDILTKATDQVSIFVMKITDLRKKVLSHVQAGDNYKGQFYLNKHIPSGEMGQGPNGNGNGHTDDKERDDASRELGPES